MNTNRPDDLTKELDEFVRRKEEELNREIEESIRISKMAIVSAIEDSKEKMLVEIEHSVTKDSILKRIGSFLKTGATKKEDKPSQ